ncbi:MAG: peptidoglycan domain protein [Bacteroidia bacterium]|nr:peptidoglycan domain protein [Bacteroidia bacterium]
MADHKLAIPKIRKWEGGWSDNANDPGGATMCGITFDTFIGYRMKKGLPKPTKDDLRNISLTEWMAVFKEEYWDEFKADEIQNQSIANFLIDWFWMSFHNASKGIQRIVGVVVDGEIGAKTIAAINSTDQAGLFNQIRAARMAYYDTIIKKNAKLETFRNGWLNRLNDYKYEP